MTTLFKNAKIYTADKDNLWADTLAISGSNIMYVGSFSKLPHNLKGIKTKTIDMKGKVIIPGIIDSHMHPASIAKTTWHVKLPLTYELNELLSYIKQYADNNPKEEAPFLYFEYYNSVMFGEEEPRKELLDEVVSDRPCLVQEFGEHMAWVNSKMLECLGVDRNIPNQDNISVFVRDENGEPTGLVKEMAWKRYEETMYQNIGWWPPEELTKESMQPVLDYLSEHGVTAIADAFIENESILKVLKDIENKGELHVYYDGYVRCDSLKQLPEKIAEAKRYQNTYGSSRIKVNTMKLFIDGTNEGGTSFLVDPKENDPDKSNHGEIAMSLEELEEYLLYCNDNSFDVHIHLVGDGAFRICCDAMENVKKRLDDKWKVQLTLAHCELIHPNDMLRPAELGISINWTPRWSGGCYGEQAKKYIKEERWNTMYQFNPMIQAGIPVAFSSDVINWGKIERANPFYGMQIGHTRVDIYDPLDPERFEGSVRPPEDAKLSRNTLMYGSTILGAQQLHWDDIMGSLEEGKLANLVVLSEDYFETDPFKISEIKCDAVFFEGSLIYGDLGE